MSARWFFILPLIVITLTLSAQNVNKAPIKKQNGLSKTPQTEKSEKLENGKIHRFGQEHHDANGNVIGRDSVISYQWFGGQNLDSMANSLGQNFDSKAFEDMFKGFEGFDMNNMFKEFDMGKIQDMMNSDVLNNLFEQFNSILGPSMMPPNQTTPNQKPSNKSKGL
jgi:hypothetical protein